MLTGSQKKNIPGPRAFHRQRHGPSIPAAGALEAGTWLGENKEGQFASLVSASIVGTLTSGVFWSFQIQLERPTSQILFFQGKGTHRDLLVIALGKRRAHILVGKTCCCCCCCCCCCGHPQPKPLPRQHHDSRKTTGGHEDDNRGQNNRGG